MLTHVKTVIVDEIHAMANDKRGAHLVLVTGTFRSHYVSHHQFALAYPQRKNP